MSKRKWTVIILDRSQYQDQLVDRLKAKGHDPRTVWCFEEAMETINSIDWDLFLIDPDQGSFLTTKEVKNVFQAAFALRAENANRSIMVYSWTKESAIRRRYGIPTDFPSAAFFDKGSQIVPPIVTPVYSDILTNPYVLYGPYQSKHGWLEIDFKPNAPSAYTAFRLPEAALEVPEESLSLPVLTITMIQALEGNVTLDGLFWYFANLGDERPRHIPKVVAALKRIGADAMAQMLDHCNQRADVYDPATESTRYLSDLDDIDLVAQTINGSSDEWMLVRQLATAYIRNHASEFQSF